MFKACAKCGKIHRYNDKCIVPRVYSGEERKLRSTNAWTQKSLEIREKANYLCEVCKDKGIWEYNNLEVHHIVKLKNKNEGLLDNYNLVCLCRGCHKKADEGLIDKDYLLSLARHREEYPPTL